MKYVLDANIITYYLKGNEKILDKVDQEAEKDNIIIPPRNPALDKAQFVSRPSYRFIWKTYCTGMAGALGQDAYGKTFFWTLRRRDREAGS
jgi:hypothetical protein